MTAENLVRYNFITDHIIHEFIFTESSRNSMDEYFAFLYEIYDEHLKGKPAVRIILDVHQSGMLPVKYGTLVMERMFKDLAPFPKPYIAYLYASSTDRSLISGMDYTTALKPVDRLSFPYDEREKAIEWLLTKAVD